MFILLTRLRYSFLRLPLTALSYVISSIAIVYVATDFHDTYRLAFSARLTTKINSSIRRLNAAVTLRRSVQEGEDELLVIGNLDGNYNDGAQCRREDAQIHAQSSPLAEAGMFPVA